MGRSKMPLSGADTSPSFDSDAIVASVVSRSEAIEEILTHSATRDEAPPLKSSVPLHRVAAVRKEQNVSLTRAARSLGVEIAEARRQEKETTDLTLSQLYRWRKILEVPIGELTLEAEEIPNNPIRNRSQLIKMMKSVRSIMEASKDESITIMAQLLADMLIELMPELKSISAWPSVGQSREQRDLGQAAYRRFDATISRRLEE